MWRYSGDDSHDTTESISDVLNGHDAAVLGTITLDEESPSAMALLQPINVYGLEPAKRP